MANRTLMSGGTVISVDPAVGDFPQGDVNSARVRRLATESRDDIMRRAGGKRGARLGGDWIPAASPAAGADTS